MISCGDAALSERCKHACSADRQNRAATSLSSPCLSGLLTFSLAGAPKPPRRESIRRDAYCPPHIFRVNGAEFAEAGSRPNAAGPDQRPGPPTGSTRVVQPAIDPIKSLTTAPTSSCAVPKLITVETWLWPVK